MQNHFNSDLWKKTPIVISELIKNKLFDIQKKTFLSMSYNIHFLKNLKPVLQNEKFFQKFLFEYYSFLIKIESNYINISQNPSFELDKSFRFISLNRNTSYIRSIIVKYVFPKDYDRTIIAGGFFSNYTINPISIRFREIFDLLNNARNIDIYILTNNIEFYSGYYNKKLDWTWDYRFSRFKIITDDKEIINFIFPNLENNIRLRDLINDFDLDYSKIFYTYKYDSIFAHVHLFENYKSIQKRFIGKNQVKNLNIYKSKLKFFYFCFKTTIFEMKSDDLDCIPYNFWDNDLTRFVKYVFKGYFDYEDIDELFQIILFFRKPLTEFLKNNY